MPADYRRSRPAVLTAGKRYRLASGLQRAIGSSGIPSVRDDSNVRNGKLRWPAVHRFVLILLLAGSNTPQGGPPMMVDDPDTPGPGCREINVASVFENSSSATGRAAQATYAQVEMPTGRSMADKGFLPDGVQFLLPIEFTLQIGRLKSAGSSITAGRERVTKYGGRRVADGRSPSMFGV